MNIKPFCTLLLSATIGLAGQAQVNDPGKVAKDAGANHVNNDMSNATESGLNKAENSIKGLFKKKKVNANDANKNANDTNKNANNANNAAGAGNVAGAAQQGPVSIKAYNNYDFVPGDKIVFEDHFTDDQEGEFPTHWELGAGQAVINKMEGENVFMLTGGNYCHVKPLIKSPVYLTDVFTIEYDTYPTEAAFAPKLYFYASDKQGSDLGCIQVGSETASYNAGSSEGKSLSGDMPSDIRDGKFYNKWHHVAIAYKNRQVKIYVDQYRVAVVPNCNITPGAFDIEGIGDAQAPMIIKNIRVAQGGGMNMLGQKFTDAKIITHGINFDIDKAIIRPESMGTLNMIVSILKNNPDIKFEVDGHTDNTGAAAHNLSLSQQRAEAVKTQLISMGVDAGRLSSKGLGDTKPISDNSTLEGKANNRRVEFVKM